MFVNLARAPLGAPVRLDAVGDLVAAAARRAGIATVHPHQMRHAFASNVQVEDGIPEILAEQRLGHDVPGTRGVYAHV